MHQSFSVFAMGLFRHTSNLGNGLSENARNLLALIVQSKKDTYTGDKDEYYEVSALSYWWAYVSALARVCTLACIRVLQCLKQ